MIELFLALLIQSVGRPDSAGSDVLPLLLGLAEMPKEYCFALSKAMAV